MTGSRLTPAAAPATWIGAAAAVAAAVYVQHRLFWPNKVLKPTAAPNVVHAYSVLTEGTIRNCSAPAGSRAASASVMT